MLCFFAITLNVPLIQVLKRFLRAFCKPATRSGELQRAVILRNNLVKNIKNVFWPSFELKLTLKPLPGPINMIFKKVHQRTELNTVHFNEQFGQSAVLLCADSINVVII